MNNKKENTKSISVDPNLLIDSIEEVNTLVDCHVKILTTVKELIAKYVKNGMQHDEAASVALTLHKRAAEKARNIVPNDISEEKVEEENDEGNGDNANT